MTVAEYRSNPERVAHARAILENPDLQEMLQVILLDAPCNAGIDPMISPQLAQILFGSETGHFRFYARLLSLGKHPVTLPNLDEAAMALEPED